mmetsp:Transcript_7183/g.12137  ORF Transcript_7183/g.12137 Transcript_7183/m.12137 type:complete len:472 (-) Transcript_7183:30-1445(-)
MDVFDLSDFEFEELEDFEEWSKCEVIRSDDALDKQSGSSSGSTSDDYDSVSLFSNSSFVSNEAPKRKHQDYLNSLTSEELQNLQQRYKLSRPRIIKSDFRRNFPAMWVNVFNSCSYEYLLRHINTFYEPDVTMQQRDLRPLERVNASAENVKSYDLQGRSVLQEFWFKAMNVAPDVVCHLKHSFVKVRSDGTSTVRCSFVLNGTKIVQLLDSKDLDHIQIYAQRNAQDAAQAGDGVSATVAAVAAVAPNKIRTVLKRRNPVPSTAPIPLSMQEKPLFAARLAGESDPGQGTIKATELNDRATWSAADTCAQICPKPLVNTATTPLREISEMDSTDAVKRYIQATEAVKQCTKKKRVRRPKPSQDWYNLVQDAQKVSTLERLRDTTYNIPLARLKKISTQCHNWSDEDFLRASNSEHEDEGLSYMAHALRPPSGSNEPAQVVLTAQLDFLCSIEMNFNADQKIEAIVLNYIT